MPRLSPRSSVPGELSDGEDETEEDLLREVIANICGTGLRQPGDDKAQPSMPVPKAAELVVRVFTEGSDSADRYQALLDCLFRQMGPAPFRKVLEDDTTSAVAGGHASRFTDGGAGHDLAEPLQFFQEPPSMAEADLPRQVAGWVGPKGRLWIDEEGDDMVGTAMAVAQRSSLGKGAEAAALYTMQVQARVVWFSGSDDSFSSVGRGFAQELESSWQRAVSDPASQAITVWVSGGDGRKVELRKVHPTDELHVGVRDGRKRDWSSSSAPIGSGGERPPTIMGRYTNANRGDPRDSTLHDSAAWLAVHDQGWDGDEQRLLPPAAVLELLMSTAVYGTKAVPHESSRWQFGPSLGEEGEAFAEACVAETNQKKYCGDLHQRWKALVADSPEALRLLVERKSAHEALPAPGTLLHSVELQYLGLRGSPDRYHFALSGALKLGLMPGDSTTRLVRIDAEHPVQPYWILNHAMRSAQNEDTSLVLQVTNADGFNGRYEAAYPWGWAPGRPVAPQSASGDVARWCEERSAWMVNETPLPAGAEVTLGMGTFMLRQVTPLMWYLEHALQELVKEAGRRTPNRLYRGLAGVTLDPGVYGVGKVIMWSQFSSSSADMSVAQSFTGGTAVIFTIVAKEVVCVAPASRFQREREFLFPSNSRFIVERSLGEEFAELLGMSAQLFELRAVTWREAVAVRIRRAMAVVSGAHAPRRVGTLFEATNALEDGDRDVGDAARLLVSHDRGIPSAPEAAAHLGALCAVAGLCPAEVATEALCAVADDGQAEDVEALVTLGASPCGK
eukprot:Hpha_TRINITY_DN33545_c0_g1::TRINITY_DN33545_c0_g1_i1::g.171004::m.171004